MAAVSQSSRLVEDLMDFLSAEVGIDLDLVEGEIRRQVETIVAAAREEGAQS